MATNISEKVDPTAAETVVAQQVEDCESSGFDPKRIKALIRKLDRHLLPLLTVLYLLSYLDRTNIGNARLAGLEKDLGMTGLDYNVSQISSRVPQRPLTVATPP